MKICVLVPTFLPKIGGTEIAVSSLAREWRRAGHWVGVLTQTPRHLEAHDEGFEYPVRRYPRPVSLRGWFWGIRRRLSQWHRDESFDLISAHVAYPAGYAACLWGQRHNVPVVVTCRGVDVTRTSRFRDRPYIVERLGWCLKMAQAVTAISDDLAAEVADLSGGRKAVVINNGADTDLASPVAPPVGQPWYPALTERPFLLYMKRLQGTKGHDVLIHAYAEACREMGQPPRLAFAGIGSQEAVLRELVAKLGLESDVLFLGQAEGDVKKWLLQNCLAFVHPSLREGFGIVVLEAMLCGKAILAARSEGLTTLVEEGCNGWLVEAGSVEAMKAGLLQLLRCTDLAAMGRASIERSKLFGWEKASREYLAVFEEARKAGAASP